MVAQKVRRWVSESRLLLVGLLSLHGVACSRDQAEIVRSTTQTTEIDEDTNCFTEASCGLYACDSNHDCYVSCARDHDCDMDVAYCEQSTGTCETFPVDGGSGDGGTGCGLYAPDGESCFTDCRNDDMCAPGAFCYQSTACHVDHCVGVNVEDGLVCTSDSCDQNTGVVSHENYPSTSGCFDSNPCNGEEMCNGFGSCLPGTPLPISDNDACTADSCNPISGEITHTPLTEADVDDHNPCTTDVCNPTTGQSHAPVTVGTACDDSDTCNGHETCSASGQCLPGSALANGSTCSRGNLCLDDRCQSGVCTPGNAFPIPDADTCTLDTCTPTEGVRHHQCTPLDRSVSTVLSAAAAFLHTGPDPVQSGSVGFMMPPATLSVLRGRVYGRNSAPIPGVSVSVVDHQWFGHTVTQGNGDFDIAVSGGQTVRLRFELAPYLTVERSVFAPIQDYAVVSDVILTVPDSLVTVVDLSGSQSNYQVANGSWSIETVGTRRATLLVPPGTQATMSLPDNSTQPLPSMHFRATEYSVGSLGPKALPATLPPGAAYTYSVQLAADEARAVGATKVEFSQPLALYVENFLGLKVGTSVPHGFYDPAGGSWTPAGKGVVLKILGASGGQAVIDFTGDDVADGGGSIGITSGELMWLDDLYSVGQQLWRVPVSHFTDAAAGWPEGADTDCPPSVCKYNGQEVPCSVGLIIVPCDSGCGPGLPTCNQVQCPAGLNGTSSTPNCPSESRLFCCPDHYNADTSRNLCTRDTGFGGNGVNVLPVCDYPTPPASPDGNGPGDCEQPHASTIRCQRQSLGEDIAIAGTPYRLHYESDRQLGRKSQLRIPITSDRPPAGLLGVDLQVSVAGRIIPFSFSNAANQTSVFTWDGKDVYGRLLQGTQTATVELGNRFASTYRKSDVFGMATDGTSLTVPARQTMSLKKIWKGNLEFWDALPAGLGGWSLNVNHVYDVSGRVLRLGDGTNRSLTYIPPVIRTVAGTGSAGPASGDGGLATAAVVPSPTSVAFSPEGRMYISDGQACIRMIYPDGFITTFAGNCSSGGFSGDGGPATAAKLQNPSDLSVGPDGTVYIADTLNHRIRRVVPGGIISTVAGSGPVGTGQGAFSGDGSDALQARFSSPTGVDIGDNGVLYIADSGNARIRSISSDGAVRTVAGGGAASPGNEGAATAAVLSTPSRVRYRADGSLFIAEPSGQVVRRVGPDGIIHAFAGNTGEGYFGDGSPAKAALLRQPTDIAVRTDGAVMILDQNNTVRLVVPSGTISTLAGVAGSTTSSGDNGPAAAATFKASQGIRVAPDGNVYLACTTDNQVRRLGPALTGFSSPSDLIEFASEDGRLIDSFDGRGRHLQTSDALTGAVLMQFTYDFAGRLASVTDVAGNVTRFEHDSSGNPSKIVAPFGQETLLTVDANNYLETVTDPANYQTSFSYDANGLMLSKTDPNLDVAYYSYDTLGRLLVDQDAALGSKTLARTDTPTGFTVTLTTLLGSRSSFETKRDADGTFARVSSGPDHLNQSLSFAPNGVTTTTAADGTTTTSRQLTDPRYGMLAPTLSVTTKTPLGLTQTRSMVRTATKAGGNLTTLTETTTLNGKIWSSTFDVGTRTWHSVSPLNRYTDLVLDSDGRVKDFTRPGITKRSTQFDSSGRIKSIDQGLRNQTFDYFNTQNAWNGYLQSVANALSQTTTFTRDARGRATSETTDGVVTGVGWDGLDNLSSVTPPGQPAHGMSYTPVSLMDQYTPPALASIIAPETTYVYDADRRPQAMTRPDGEVLNYGYDAFGRLSTIQGSAGTVTSKYYDATVCTGCAPGRLKQVLHPSQGVTVGFTYDGRLSKGIEWSGNVAGSVGWTYDANFRRVAETVAGTSGSASSIKFEYDDDGLLTCASPSTCGATPGTGSMTLLYDVPVGFLMGTELSSTSSSMTYNAFGELATEVGAIGSNTRYAVSYDDENHPRDGLGRVLHKVETLESDTTTTDYEYDGRGRLWKVYENGATTPVRSYSYDSNGNRGGGTTASYDAQDRLESDGTYTYSYTKNGELKTKTNAATTALTSYTYDVFGNLRRVDLPNNDYIEYVVDGQNRRVAKKKNGAVVARWLYRDQLHPVAELNADGTIAKRFVYASGKNSPDYVIQGSTTYRIFSDELGSPRVMVNAATGLVAARMRHDEFGIVLEDTVSLRIPFGFAGGLYDPDTGLVRFGARDYDPNVGRWTSKDPTRFRGGVNLYVYAWNDPVNFLDRTGRQPTGPKGTGGASGTGEGGSEGGGGIPWTPAQPWLRDPTDWCGSGANGKYVPDTDTLGSSNLQNACYAHDNCYSNCGSDKFDCDWNLGHDMARDCAAQGDTCDIASIVYFGAVSGLGQSAYNSAQANCVCGGP